MAPHPDRPAKRNSNVTDPNAKAGAAPANGAFIEVLRPTPDRPALRRYVPRAPANTHAELAARDVLDWREAPPEPGLPDIAPVQDKIICGAAEASLRALPDESVACVITSPPYWNIVDYGFEGQLGTGTYEEYIGELLGVWRQCERILEPNGKLCINVPIMPIAKSVMPGQHTRHIKNLSSDIEGAILAELALERFSLYAWQKQTTEKMFGSYPYPPNIFEQNTLEFINVLVKPGKPKTLPPAIKEASRLTQKQWMNLSQQVWRLYPADVKRAAHPAPFPEALPNRLVAMYTFAACAAGDVTFPGDVVVDPFCGTGATCVAAKRLGRHYVGIDLSVDFTVRAQERSSATERDDSIFMCHSSRVSGSSHE